MEHEYTYELNSPTETVDGDGRFVRYVEDTMPEEEFVETKKPDRDGSSSQGPSPSKDGGESGSPSKRWKRGILAARAEGNSPEASTEAEDAQLVPQPEQSNKAAKRIKAREESRQDNDLMKCFLRRAQTTVVTDDDIKKEPSASSSSSGKKGS